MPGFWSQPWVTWEELTPKENYAHSDPLFEEALDIGTRICDTEPVLGDTLLAFASSLRLQHKMNRVELLLKKAQAVYEKTSRMRQMRGVGLLTNFGFLRMDEGKYFAAEEYIQQALRLLTGIFGPDAPSIALTEINLADAALRAVTIANVTICWTTVTRLSGRNSLRQHPSRAGGALLTYSRFLSNTSRTKEAAELRRRANTILALKE